MTLNEIAYTIIKRVKPYLSDDSDLTLPNVKHDIIAERADLIKKTLDKNKIIDDVLIQDLGCVGLETVDAAECCEFNSGCTVLRTKKEIPQEIFFTRIGPIVKTKKKYNFVSYEEAINSDYKRFAKNEVFAYILNNRIYIKSNLPEISLLEVINIRGVIEDPREVKNFTNCDNTICYSDDTSFPLPMWMEVYIREKLIKHYLRSEQIPLDLSNDANDQSGNAS